MTADTARALRSGTEISAAVGNFFSCLSLYPILNANRIDAFDNLISAINSNIYNDVTW